MLLRRFIRNAFFVAVCLPVPAEFAYAQDTATVPEAPDIYFLAHNDGKVFLMWQPGSDGGSPILKYQIQQKSGTDSFGGWEDILDSGPNTARHTVENLQNGTTYTFEVRAVNEIGEGAAAQVEGRPRAPVWQLTLSSYTVIEGDPEGDHRAGADHGRGEVPGEPDGAARVCRISGDRKQPTPRRRRHRCRRHPAVFCGR